MAARQWLHALPAIRRKGTRHESPKHLTSSKRGAHMSIAQISLPKGVGPHAGKLFDAITQASNAEDFTRLHQSGQVAGFTTNPTLILKAAEMEAYQGFVDEAVRWAAASIEGGGPIAGLRLSVGNELGMLTISADAEKLEDYVRYTLLLRASFRF